jgi:hypothetical protein
MKSDWMLDWLPDWMLDGMLDEMLDGMLQFDGSLDRRGTSLVGWQSLENIVHGLQ